MPRHEDSYSKRRRLEWDCYLEDGSMGQRHRAIATPMTGSRTGAGAY